MHFKIKCWQSGSELIVHGSWAALRRARLLEVPPDHIENHFPVVVGQTQERAGWDAAAVVAEVVRRRVDEVGARNRAGLVGVGEDRPREIA